MTKDWEAARPYIKHLSVEQKKSLQEVKSAMEKKHKFRASTRAYRMKLKEWGYLRHNPRKAGHTRSSASREDIGVAAESDSDIENESDRSATAGESATMTASTAVVETTASMEDITVTGNTTSVAITFQEEREDLLPAIDPWSQSRTMTTEILMQMMDAVLEGDAQRLEKYILANPNHINYPIGLPFEAHGGRFFNHPAMKPCVILQHLDQKMLDIASALPTGPVMWVLMAHGAKGSKHPNGTDLAIQNAIKNGRAYNVQALLNSGQSNLNGNPEASWRPLQQAVLWNMPDIVSMLLDRGAYLDEVAPPAIGIPSKSPLQLVLELRIRDYRPAPVRERYEKILKMLLDSGADINAPLSESTLTPFEMFVAPWQTNPAWIVDLGPTAGNCLEAFVRRNANLGITFPGFPCSAASGKTLKHQLIWHSTPGLARLLVDHSSPAPGGNGLELLIEIVGCCPLAKRHPADTLRDLEVLFKRGADPNMTDDNGVTPLMACIERCPNVDLLPRLQALLDGGANPKSQSTSCLPLITHAVRWLEEPILSQVLELLLSKSCVRRSSPSQPTWSANCIAENPTFDQVAWASDHSTEFVHLSGTKASMVPDNVVAVCRKAAFDVSSRRYLDAITKRLGMGQSNTPTIKEMKDILHVIAERRARDLPEYSFPQSFVISLLSAMSTATPVPAVPESSQQNPELYAATSLRPGGIRLNESDALGQTTSSLPIPFPIDTPLPPGTGRRGSTSSVSSNGSATSFFISSTTQIRWPAIGRATRPDDIEKAKGAVLKYKCKSCNNGPKLTKAEYKKHDEEHLHTVTCFDIGCKRRFCVAERG